MSQLTTSDILSGDSSEFAKFRNWLLKHTDTQPCITLRHFTQSMDPHYHEFRQTAIKSQLAEGFNLILNYEQFVKDRIPSSSSFSNLDHPFPFGHNLIEISKLWATVCVQKELTDFIQIEIDKTVQRKFAEAKRTISHLLSLLAAMDAVPLEYIPIIQFEPVNYSDIDILTSNERCIELTRRRERILKEISEAREKIVSIAGSYLPGSESQIALFHTLIGAQRVHYQNSSRTLGSAADVSAIADYINHPNSIAQPLLKKLAEEKTASKFSGLTHEIAEVFQLQSRDEIVITSLVLSAAVMPLFWVDLKAEGVGTEDIELIGLALELITIGDPVEFLVCIEGRVSPEKLQGRVDAAVMALRAITGAWKELCAFVSEATVAEYLSATLNTVRFALGQAIEPVPE